LPDLEIKMIKVKVDTGARSSSLHAFNQRVFEKDGVQWVRFQVHPVQRKSDKTVEVQAEIVEFRSVRSSSGKTSMRPVILTNVTLLGFTWPVELTLARRDEMGFRMLLGREAFRGRFLVNAGKSFYNGKPKRKRKISTKKYMSTKEGKK
ncbi:MAG: RimK/LysX family protein, partial [Desulfobulbaceae bacterium]|nr:RimK/LysX family protein [Desulfobulbaceae bacterium]